MAQNDFKRHENGPFYVCAFAPESQTQNKKKQTNISEKTAKNQTAWPCGGESIVRRFFYCLFQGLQLI